MTTHNVAARIERDAVVAFLRRVANERPHGVADAALLMAASAIEDGRHLSGSGEQEADQS